MATTTRPRQPIAAMYSGPGPVYGLPGLVGQNNHDSRSVHRKGPAFPFGVKHGKHKDECSPGPCYLPEHKVYNNGRDGTAHYSLYSRNPDLTAFKTPGPGTYNNDKTGRNAYYKPPEYSFGTRHRSRRTDQTPGPNCYSLPSVIGATRESHMTQAPNYSLVSRKSIGNFDQDLSKTPGPCAYGVAKPSITKSSAPEFSMTGRNTLPGDNTRKPGPGAHSPMDSSVNKKKAPAFSFGIRHSPYTAPLIVAAEDC